MTNIKVYLIEKQSRFDKIDVFGIAFSELIKYHLEGEFQIINTPSEIEEKGIIALLYPSTPMVTLEKLQMLATDIEKGTTKGYKIGDGCIRLANCAESELDTNMPFSVTKVANSETLTKVINEFRYTILDKHFDNGVHIVDPQNTYIDASVTIGKGSVIHPMNHIKGVSKIGENVIIYPHSDINDTIIGDNTDFRASYSVLAKVGKECTVGPYACLRKGAIIGDRCRVGDFVEIKNSTLEDDVKAAHLAYVGDSYVGENTNIGCGVVFANFDGKVKRSVVVGKDVFIGCNTNLVAPLEVEDGAYIAAGSTVTQNVPGNSLCIARARQVVKSEWDKPIKTR